MDALQSDLKDMSERSDAWLLKFHPEMKYMNIERIPSTTSSYKAVQFCMKLKKKKTLGCNRQESKIRAAIGKR